MSKSAVIVGAGLGGLLCGRILSREGWQVTLLEASERPGGLLQPFLWDGIPCECGFHSVGGLGPGEPLEILFRKLDLMHLPWYRAQADEGFPFLRLNSGSDLESAHVLAPYGQSVWRLQGGGNTLVQALAEGLDIRYGAKVQSIENQCVYCENAQSFQADIVISSLHPLTSLSLLCGHIRPSYAHRLSKLVDGADIFTVYCRLEPACVPWQSGAIFLDQKLMLHFGEVETGVLELLCFGEGNPEDMIAVASERLQGLSVQSYCTVLHPGYGPQKLTEADYIAPQTPLPWFFLTGQGIGLHGILGTTVSAFHTCKSITK